MNLIKTVIWANLMGLLLVSCTPKLSPPSLDQEKMMVRISEIEIDSNYLDDYNKILMEEAAASVQLEAGVIAIFPMFQVDNPTQVRILEIYKNDASYKSHLQTPHFKHYKTSTLHMVKSLKLIDMQLLDSASMKLIFEKM